VNLGTESRKKTIWAAVLGGVAVLLLLFQILPMLFGPSTTTSANTEPAAVPAARTAAQRRVNPAAKKTPAVKENLDPTLRLDLLAASEQTKYEGSGRNIFVSQAEPVKIPEPAAPAVTDQAKVAWQPPPPPPPKPIPLKFFGFASKPGEPKRIFLSAGEDVFIAGEGEIVDRRYKVLRISPNSVEIQDVVGSDPPQSIPLTQG